MKERGILFKGEMVRAILSGQKTQTRRVVKHERLEDSDTFAFDSERGLWEMGECHQGPIARTGWMRCPYGVPDDRLWVRETWAVLTGAGHRTVYRADGEPEQRYFPGEPIAAMKWRPSLLMPRKHCRLVLEVTDVRVERLQDISEEDAKAEGVEAHDDDGVTYYGPINNGTASAREAFRWLWESINSAESWAANPWCWVVGFRRLP